MNDIEYLMNEGYNVLYQVSKYEYYCSDELGYKYKINIRNYKRGSLPYKFHKGNKYSIDNIELYLKLNNLTRYELLTRKYKNNNTNMLWRVWRDNKYLYFRATWANFMRGNVPSIDRKWGDAHRMSFKEIKKILDNFLLTNNLTGWTYDKKSLYRYKNKNSYITFIHEDGYVYPLLFGNISKKNTIPILNINHKEESTKNMYILIDKNTPYSMKEGQEYNGDDALYIFICKDHGEFKNTIYRVLKGTKCPICHYESRIGENHPNYNPDLTDEERKIRREYPEYREWRIAVYERDNYTCQVCGDNKGGNLVAHHKDGYNWCKERRTDVSNGVTLCDKCHDEFHSIYGYGNNTEEQFNEFLRNKMVIS